MSIVLDASVALAWGFPDESNDYADRVLATVVVETGVVPALWSLEISNAILIGERKGRLTMEAVERFASLIAGLPIALDSAPALSLIPSVLALGRRFQLSAYDAAYLELAVRSKFLLATLDGRLRRAAQEMGVALLLN